MKNKQLKFIAVFILLALFSCFPAEGQKKMTDGKVLYSVSLENDQGRTIIVRQSGKNLKLYLEGFGQAIALNANGGGVETCRTTLEHKSDQATIILSLPIPLPNVPCQMMAGFVSINSERYKISIEEKTIKKVTGNDAQLRKAVEKSFGKINGEK